MSRADYAHWNEEQDRVWWEEEGRHVPEYDPDPDFLCDPDDEPEECQTPDDCVRWSCFSTRSLDNEPWECDICGRPAKIVNNNVIPDWSVDNG